MRVRYAETDKMGVVYYANYFVWFEVARADLLRSLGWSYREMEQAGVSLPVIEAHCEYHRPARYDDELEVRAEGRMLSPVRMEFTYQVVRRRRPGGRGVGPDRARRGGSDGPAVPAAGADHGRCSHEGAGDRRGRLHRLAPGGGAARRGARGGRPRLLHRLLPAGDQGSEPRREPAAGPGFRFVEARIQDADLRGAARRRDHVFHLAAQAGVRKSWGRDFRIYTDNNVDASQQLLEACVGRPLHRFVYASSSSVYGDNAAIPMREDALPQPVSPYGVTKLAAEQLCYLYHVNHGVPADVGALLHGLRAAAAAGHGVPPVHPRGAQRRADRALRRRRADPGLHVRGRRGRGDDRGRRTRRAGPGVQHRRRLARDGQPGAGDHRRIAGRPLDVRREPAQKGDMRDTYADTTLARADLGFAPTVSLEQGMEAEYRWLSTTPALALMAARVRRDLVRIARRWRCVLAASCWRARSAPEAAARSARSEPDKFLFERGTEELNDKHWFTAREYFRQLVDSYPQSTVPRRREARHRRHVSRRGHRRSATCSRSTSSASSCRSTRRTRAPTTRSSSSGWRTSTRCADPMRDQTETLEAIRELTVFVERYPNAASALLPEAQKRLREARDRLGDRELGVGVHYFRTRWYPGRHRAASRRCSRRIRNTRRRDAVLFYLASRSIRWAGRPRRCPTSTGSSRNSNRASSSKRRRSWRPTSEGGDGQEGQGREHAHEF